MIALLVLGLVLVIIGIVIVGATILTAVVSFIGAVSSAAIIVLTIFLVICAAKKIYEEWIANKKNS